MGLRDKVEVLANIATVCAATLLSAVLIKVYLLPASSAPSAGNVHPTEAIVGTSLKDRLAGVDFSRNGKTLILAISTHCHFCTESSPFFRRLGDEVRKKAKLVAVLPEPIAEAEQYLRTEGVQIDQIKQASAAAVGIRGTYANGTPCRCPGRDSEDVGRQVGHTGPGASARNGPWPDGEKICKRVGSILRA